MRDRKVTDRAARSEISCCAPRFADIEISTNTSHGASRVTRLRPGDLRFGNRAWDSIAVKEVIDRLKDLVVTNDRSAVTPGGAGQSVQPCLVKRLHTAARSIQVAYTIVEASAPGGPRSVTCTSLLIPSSTGRKGVIQEGTISRERGASDHVA